jgi:NAD(P)-dependent dehydrogenase (short-subunit alcohol dehydrogenase family)
MTKIKGKVALVTGANRGIGRAFVNALIEAGAAKIYAAARNTDTLSDLVADNQGRVVAIELDVTKPDVITSLSVKLTDVEILINNAGIARFTGLLAAPNVDSAREELETNYFGTLNMIRAFAPVLGKNGGGSIVNLGSVASYINFPVLGSYSASKAAVHSLTQGVRAELAAQGTTVMGVYPGPIDTDMAENFPMDKTSPSIVAKAVLDGIEAGAEDVYPDPAAKEMHGAYLIDPKAVEKQAGTMLPD